MIVNSHSFHEQLDWIIRSIIIVRIIEDQFIPHSFEPGSVFMIFHSMNMIIDSHSFHEQLGWWIRKKGTCQCSWIKHHNHHNQVLIVICEANTLPPKHLFVIVMRNRNGTLSLSISSMDDGVGFEYLPLPFILFLHVHFMNISPIPFNHHIHEKAMSKIDHSLIESVLNYLHYLFT